LRTCTVFPINVDETSDDDLDRPTRKVICLFTMKQSESPDSVVDIATGFGLDGRGVGVPSPGRVKNFLHVVQTGSGGQTSLLSNVYRGPFPRG
jgi:hypothetical protein